MLSQEDWGQGRRGYEYHSSEEEWIELQEEALYVAGLPFVMMNQGVRPYTFGHGEMLLCL